MNRRTEQLLCPEGTVCEEFYIRNLFNGEGIETG